MPAVLDADELSTHSVNMDEKRRLFRWKLFFRLVASVPSLIGSLFKNNLGQILNYTGGVRRPQFAGILLLTNLGHFVCLACHQALWPF